MHATMTESVKADVITELEQALSTVVGKLLDQPELPTRPLRTLAHLLAEADDADHESGCSQTEQQLQLDHIAAAPVSLGKAAHDGMHRTEKDDEEKQDREFIIKKMTEEVGIMDSMRIHSQIVLRRRK